MSSIIGTAAGTLVAAYLPFDASTNIALGMASGQLVTVVLDKMGNVSGWIYSKIGFRRNLVRICPMEKGKINPIYKKMEEYVLNKYMESLMQCNLEPIKGEVTINLRDACFKNPLEIIQLNPSDKLIKKLYVILETSTNAHDASTTSLTTTTTFANDSVLKAPPIVLYSYTMSVNELREFVSDIAKLEKKQSNMLMAYRAIVPKKGDNPYWDSIKFLSNKTISNTIVSKTVQRDLFDDVEWFMQNEKWYNEKGVDYKRGYLLHGVPGCGKSSSIKAIANKYKMPIFNLDLETIKTNSQLISLTNDILCEVPDKPYILTIEDFDRHEMFTQPWVYANRKDKVTMQCILNVIDGIVESHGRLLIITCNDKDKIMANSALIRPGRVDKIIKFDYVDHEQAAQLINNYFGTQVQIESENLKPELTPADLIKRMQSTTSLSKVLNYVCKNTNIPEIQAIIKNHIQNNQKDPNLKDRNLKDPNPNNPEGLNPNNPNGLNPTDQDDDEFESNDDESNNTKIATTKTKKRKAPYLTQIDRKKRVIAQKRKEIAQLEKTITNADKTIQKLHIDVEFEQRDLEEKERSAKEKQRSAKEKQRSNREKQRIAKEKQRIAKKKKTNNQKTTTRKTTTRKTTTRKNQ